MRCGSYIFTGPFLQQNAGTEHWRMNHVGRAQKFLLCSSVCSELDGRKGTSVVLTDVHW